MVRSRWRSLEALRPREAEVFAALAHAYCGPEPAAAAIADTDAVPFIDSLTAGSRPLNRVGFRLILRLLDLAPLLRRQRTRFLSLDAEQQSTFVLSLERSRLLTVRSLSKLLKTLSVMAYYGDAGVLRGAGYDPAANIARARELRAREGRP